MASHLYCSTHNRNSLQVEELRLSNELARMAQNLLEQLALRVKDVNCVCQELRLGKKFIFRTIRMGDEEKFTSEVPCKYTEHNFRQKPNSTGTISVGFGRADSYSHSRIYVVAHYNVPVTTSGRLNGPPTQDSLLWEIGRRIHDALKLNRSFSTFCKAVDYLPINTMNSNTTGALWEFISQMLEGHNKYRVLHQAPPLIIDEQLNHQAQNWAEILATNDTLAYDLLCDIEQVGENVARKWKTNEVDFSSQEFVDTWYNEAQNFDWRSLEDQLSCSQFAQMVWRSTRLVGFGRAFSESGYVYVVGRYKPRGIIPGGFPRNVLPKVNKRRISLSSKTTPEHAGLASKLPDSNQPYNFSLQASQRTVRKSGAEIQGSVVVRPSAAGVSTVDGKNLRDGGDASASATAVLNNTKSQPVRKPTQLQSPQKEGKSTSSLNSTKSLFSSLVPIRAGLQRPANSQPQTDSQSRVGKSMPNSSLGIRQFGPPNPAKSSNVPSEEDSSNSSGGVTGGIMSIFRSLTGRSPSPEKQTAPAPHLNSKAMLASLLRNKTPLHFRPADTSATPPPASTLTAPIMANSLNFGSDIQRRMPLSEENFPEVKKFLMQLLVSHNECRALHFAPPLRLNSELSRTAQDWAKVLASRDKVAYDSNCKTLNIGENVAKKFRIGVTDFSGDMFTELWYDEVEFYDWKLNEFQEECKHFSQLVWRSTMEVGFGRAVSETGRVYVVGRYAPPGNNPGQYGMNVLPRKAMSQTGAPDVNSMPPLPSPITFEVRNFAHPKRLNDSATQPSTLADGGGLMNFHDFLPLRSAIKNPPAMQIEDSRAPIGGGGGGVLSAIQLRPSLQQKQTEQKTEKTSDNDQVFNQNKFQTQMLVTHNEFRALHRSPPLRLNPKLSELAQQWAEVLSSKDKISHDPRCGSNGLGENLAMKFRKGFVNFPGDLFTEMWYHEIDQYKWTGEDLTCGHFTQLVWRSSTEVGFGRAVSKSGRVYVVGRYKPPGNNSGQYGRNVLPPTRVMSRSQNNPAEIQSYQSSRLRTASETKTTKASTLVPAVKTATIESGFGVAQVRSMRGAGIAKSYFVRATKLTQLDAPVDSANTKNPQPIDLITTPQQLELEAGFGATKIANSAYGSTQDKGRRFAKTNALNFSNIANVKIARNVCSSDAKKTAARANWEPLRIAKSRLMTARRAETFTNPALLEPDKQSKINNGLCRKKIPKFNQQRRRPIISELSAIEQKISVQTTVSSGWLRPVQTQITHTARTASTVHLGSKEFKPLDSTPVESDQKHANTPAPWTKSSESFEPQSNIEIRPVADGSGRAKVKGRRCAWAQNLTNQLKHGQSKQAEGMEKARLKTSEAGERLIKFQPINDVAGKSRPTSVWSPAMAAQFPADHIAVSSTPVSICLRPTLVGEVLKMGHRLMQVGMDTSKLENLQLSPAPSNTQ